MKSTLAALVCIAFASFTLLASAQTDSTATENEIRLGIDKGTIAIGDPIKPIDYPKNLVRINPLLFLAGQTTFFYERAISNRFSAEAGLGFTSRPLILRSRGVVGSLSGEDDVDVEYGFGPTARLGLKFYPAYAHAAPRGLYIGYEVAYRAYFYDSLFEPYAYYDYNTGNLVSSTQTNYRSYSHFFDFSRITLGYNGISRSGFNSDFFVGAGVGSRELYYMTRNYGSVYGNTPLVNHETYVTPLFVMGFKIGIAL